MCFYPVHFCLFGRCFSRFFFLLVVSWAAACGSPATPLDADTRYRIDSAATEQIRQVDYELDTLCVYLRYHDMERLVDSFRQVRKRQIEEQLKNVPR